MKVKVHEGEVRRLKVTHTDSLQNLKQLEKEKKPQSYMLVAII